MLRQAHHVVQTEAVCIGGLAVGCDGVDDLRQVLRQQAAGLLRVDADCRVNGEDWDGALESLKNYAATWQGDGMMFRKQYIIIRNAPDDWPEEAEE